MKTELIFILDKSGSMSGLERDVIGGFNSMIEKQKKEEGEAIVTTVLFDTNITRLHNRVELKKIESLNEDDYTPSGCTAMLDAIGMTITDTLRDQKLDSVDKTIVVITTDGMENSSKEYSYKKIHELIEKVKKNNNFEFAFLGANIDAKKEAERLGMDKDEAVDYVSDSAGTAVVYKALNKKLAKSRMCETACADISWMEEINEDVKSRKKK